MAQKTSGSWPAWANHVLAELERLDGKDEKCDEKMAAVKESLEKRIRELELNQARLQVRAGWFGAIGASVPILITIAILILKVLLDRG